MDQPSLIKKLQEEIIQLKNLTKELKLENSKLQRKIAKIEVKYISAKKEANSWKHINDPYNDIDRGNYIRSLTEKQLSQKMKELEDMMKKYNIQ